MRKSFDFETVKVGETLGCRELVITEQMARTCADAIESRHPWYFEDSPFGRIAPPTIFDNESLNTLDEQYARFGSIHVRQAWEFENPVKIGSRVTLTVRIIDKYVHRGRPYLVMGLTAADESGLPLCRSTHTSLMTLHKEPQPC